MSQIRVYELARELSIDSKELVVLIRGLGIEVKSHMSAIDQETAETLRKTVSPPAEEEKKEDWVEEDIIPRRVKKKTRKKAAEKEPEKAPPPEKDAVKLIRIPEAITIKELAELINIKANEIIKQQLTQGKLVTVNHLLDDETAVKIADGFGVLAEKTSRADEAASGTAARRGGTVHRSPVVTIMGHVDHGKTSLLDAIRETNVIAMEKGGITQHIGAYRVDLPKGSIVFLDTPGHEAFTAMRSRGAKVTDIVVLVVAADDGVKPQTVEAIDHAKAAGVPIIIAINKVDKPDADPDNVKKQLANYDLVPEDWGGDTIFVEVSAKQKQNLDQLLEMILLLAEMQELTADPESKAFGAVVEAKVDKGRGPVATILNLDGTLHVGEYFVAGMQAGRVRAMFNEIGESQENIGPSTPVEVLGLTGLPDPGDTFEVVEDDRRARQIINLRRQKKAAQEKMKTARMSLDDLFARAGQGKAVDLPIILKADVQGSLEALSDTLHKLSTEKIALKIIHGAVGAINESDILLASASNAIVIGFNVRPPAKVVDMAQRESIDVRYYNVIYQAVDEIRNAMEGLLEPIYKDEVRGQAEVRQIFSVPRVGTVAGCAVTNGKITRSAKVRLLREGIVTYEGVLGSLRRFKDDVKEVSTGYECGMSIENYNDIKVGDVIEAYELIPVAQKL